MTVSVNTSPTTRMGSCPFCTSSYAWSKKFAFDDGEWMMTSWICSDCNSQIRCDKSERLLALEAEEERLRVEAEERFACQYAEMEARELARWHRHGL